MSDEPEADRASPRSWAIEEHWIRIANRLRISFQIAEDVEMLGRPPPSIGTAPIALAPSGWDVDLIVPVGLDAVVWLGLEPVAEDLPTAVRLEVTAPSRADALTGGRWLKQMAGSPQNYVVAPPQRSIDGVRAGPGRAHPFRGPESAHLANPAAMFRMRLFAIPPQAGLPATMREPPPLILRASTPALGDARGDGETVPQVILPDPYGPGSWRTEAIVAVHIGLASNDAYREVTGGEPPPLDRKRAYSGWRLP